MHRPRGFALCLFVLSIVGVSEVQGATCPVSVNGHSYNLDFGTFSGTEGTSFDYYYNFCENVPTTVYQGVTCPDPGNAYQIQKTLNPVVCTLIGQMSSSTVTELPNGGGLQVNMTNNACCKCVNNAVPRTVVMNIACADKPSITGFQVSEPTNPKCQYVANIAHPNACPNAASSGATSSATTGGGKHGSGGKLSPGSWFLIFFFVTVVVYVVAGFIVNVKVRGVSPGVDAVPNAELWKSVPGLVVDGIVFTKNKILGLFGRGYNQL